MNICLFSPEEIGQPLLKKDPRNEHIIKVLHKKEGETFDAGIIGGQAGKAKITKIISKDSPEAQNDKKISGAIYFDFTPESDGKPLYDFDLIVGFPRPIQLRRLLRDAAGLGAKRIFLTGTELGEKSYLESNVVSSGAAREMLIDGTAQAASTHVPELVVCKSLEECLKENFPLENSDSGKNPKIAKIALDNKNPAFSLHDFLVGKKISSCVAAIGSERGWTDNERELLTRYGFSLCGMGIRILRTETAVTVASAIILDAMGKLG